MDDFNYYDVVKKLIKEREEHYKFLHGELSALYYIDTELRERNKSN